jgi:hypothetical protein
MTVYFGVRVRLTGLPPRLMYHDSQGFKNGIKAGGSTYTVTVKSYDTIDLAVPEPEEPAPVPADDEEEEAAPWMPELHASRNAPPPTTAAPTPAARNRFRRETPYSVTRSTSRSVIPARGSGGPAGAGSRAALAADLAHVRRTGIAVNDEELESGLRSIAVPVRSRAGDVIAAVNLVVLWSPAPASELADQFGPVLQATARQISALAI